MTEPVSAAHGQGELPTGEPFTEADEVLIPSTSAQSSRAGGSSVLRLRGLPFASTESDIISFFAGYEIHEVYICRRDGRSTGEAYVVLSSPEDASTALSSLNKQYMGNRYIELFEAAQADLAAVKKVLEDSRLQGFVVRLRGLPYSATAADIAQFFSGVQIAQDEDAIVFAQSVDGRPTGEAYVELTDEQALSLAMTWHKELMGSRYIEIFNSSKVDKLQALQQSRFHVQSSQNRRARWPMLPAAAAVAAGVHLGQMSAAPLVGLPNPDQLADSLAAARINPAAAAASSSAGTLPGVVAAGPFAVPAGVTMLSNCYTINPAAVTADAAGFITAAAAAGRRPSDVVLSPAAAPGAAPAARPYQVAPQGPMLLGPDGQPQPVYYMHPAQGMMWAGQPGVARPSMPLGMVPMVPISGASLMPGNNAEGGATTAAQGGGPAPTGAWGPEVYHQAVPRGYSQQQQVYQPSGTVLPAPGGAQHYGPVPVSCIWPGTMPAHTVPVSEPGIVVSSMAGSY